MQPDQTQPPFTAIHHQAYNNLREEMMGMAARGVPGIDKVIDTLNKQHIGFLQNTAGTTPSGANSSPGSTPPQMPQGYQNYR